MAEPGLTEHLRDAIDLNRSRRAAYRRLGGLRADLLSRALVAAERALLPVARRLDREAARHAVPILRAELVDMALAPPAGRPLASAVRETGLPRSDSNAQPCHPERSEGSRGSLFGGLGPTAVPGDQILRRSAPQDDNVEGSEPAPRGMSGVTWRGASPWIPAFAGRTRWEGADRTWAADFDAARRALAVRIERERARERETGRRRALALHLLESARLSAARAVGYDRQTGGATRGLSRRIVLGHLALVPFARVLDRLAAPVHARGVGLFVHDVPPIPEP